MFFLHFVGPIIHKTTLHCQMHASRDNIKNDYEEISEQSQSPKNRFSHARKPQRKRGCLVGKMEGR